jgi:hypothetical protein
LKYTVTLTHAGVSEREKLVFESRGDLPRHIALKIIAYVLFRSQTDGLPLQIEQAVGQRHKPDLVAIETVTEKIKLWIDCGQIETDRLGRIAARNADARIVVVKATAREAERYLHAAIPDLPLLGRSGAAASVILIGFDDGFIDAFISALRGTNTLEILELGERLVLQLNQQRLESDVFSLRHEV